MLAGEPPIEILAAAGDIDPHGRRRRRDDRRPPRRNLIRNR
jgi:hypothetical protein